MGTSAGDLGTTEDEAILAADLTQLMREIDSFFCTPEREVAERYWRYYLEPEIERLFVPGIEIHSHYEGPSGQLLYNGYDGVREWADDVVAYFTHFVRKNSDWQPLGSDALLAHQHIDAIGRDSGAEIELNLWVLYLIEDNRIASIRTFPDRFLAEAAAGAFRLASDAVPPPRD